MKASISRIHSLDAHHRLLIAVGVAAVVFMVAAGVRLPTRVLVAWDAFALMSIFLAWMRIIFADARSSVREARLQDSGRTAIFFCVVVAALASVFAVGALLGSAKELSRGRLLEHLILAALTVISSWCLAHTFFALHYAHIFYQACDDRPQEVEGAGLDFPEEKHPDFLDFAYFSFVIGMTCQVSDVQITSRRIRRLALVHGLLSFVFNTVILALSVNLASGLI